MRQKQQSTQPKMTNGPSDLFSIPEDEFAELVWENGQIVMHSQSSRSKKSSFLGRYGGVQEKDARGCVNAKFAQSSAPDNFGTSRHPAHSGVNAHDDDMVPWINYPIDEVLATETLQNDYCVEFLNEFSAFDTNPLSAHKSAIANGRSAGFTLEARNTSNVEHGNTSKAPMGNLEPDRIRTSQFFQLPQQCESPVPNTKSSVVDVGAAGNHATQEDQCGDMADRRLQNKGMSSSKQLPQPSTVTSLVNFSHFARPAALAKVSLRSGGLRSTEKVSTPSSLNAVTSAPAESANGVKNVNRVSGQSGSSPNKLDFGSSMKAPQGGCSVEQSNTVCLEDNLRKNSKTESKKLPDDLASSSFAASAAVCRPDIRKDLEAVVASSSMCSGNVTGAASNEPKLAEKRKEYDGEDSDYHSEDLQDESVGIRKPPSGRGMRTKRSRAAEVHNLSERRRRNRINEKMRALQELIPNCNKVDKASMLEEAIEYLKTLQLQVQIMSMGSGLYMPPMMLPPAMQHICAPNMAHFSPIGVGLGTGIGLAPGCPMIPIPPMHAPQFPYIPTSGLNGVPGPVNPTMFGVQGQGIPVLMPRPLQFSTFAGLSMNANSVPEVNADANTAVAGEQQQNNLNAEQNTSTEETQISASTQGTRECL
ncbi:transcription factor PIF3-like isoform X1 [Canna indica]|uniref:Transcription factor PIF3-like isoform X1 n=1 Tax=Canna indica TaxID=4628 RepID=A0AAQ3JS34_9LILI|nr:transcription factor PIF3-like isoform X1 [Canna indica]